MVLVIIGSTRNKEDEALLQSLKKFVIECNLSEDSVRFIVNQSYSVIKEVSIQFTLKIITTEYIFYV